MKPRVVMLAERLPPEFTGSGRQAVYLAAALARAGYRVTALSSRPWGEASPRDGEGIEWVKLAGPSDGWRRSLLFLLRSAWWLARHRGSYDLVHVHGWCWAAMAVPLLGKPCLYKTAIPGDDDPATIRRTRGGGVKRALIGRYDRFPAISTLVAGMLSADGIEPGRIAAIPNGVEGRFRPGTAAEREAARARLLPAHAFPPGTLLVLYVGSVERRKGIDTLAHAWLRVAAEVPAARLLMVGPGDPDGAYFRDVGVILGRELGSTAVIADRVADPLECYRAADLFVFPSRNESFGNVLVEAMACGLPVVATRIDGVTGDLVTDRADGLVVPNEDPAALARALLELLRDPGLRARLGGEAARTVDARFRIDRVAAKYLELYRGLTAGR